MEEKTMKTLTPEMIEEILRRVRTAVHPLRVLLFGSAARGRWGRGVT
jgi:predicted nucleotidyltransferase